MSHSRAQAEGPYGCYFEYAPQIMQEVTIEAKTVRMQDGPHVCWGPDAPTDAAVYTTGEELQNQGTQHIQEYRKL